MLPPSTHYFLYKKDKMINNRTIMLFDLIGLLILTTLSAGKKVAPFMPIPLGCFIDGATKQCRPLALKRNGINSVSPQEYLRMRWNTAVKPTIKLTNMHVKMNTPNDENVEYWRKQTQLADSIRNEEITLRNQQAEAFANRRLALVSDTVFFSCLIFSSLWFVSETPLTALSYLCGAVLSTAYSYGLGKYVETLGEDQTSAAAKSGKVPDLGQARFVLIIILLAALAKFRGQTGLQEIPTIAGFFTYQIASFSQGMKDLDENFDQPTA